MNISAFFGWFYSLSFPSIVRIFIIAVMVFLYLDRRLHERRWWWGGLAAVLVLWFGATLAATVLTRTSSVSEPAFAWLPLHSYREALSGGNLDILRSNLMNVALFFPAGLLLGRLLPRRWCFWARLLTVAAVLGSVSLAIELIQFSWLLGQAEIDDVLHNTLGAACGCLAFSFGTRTNHKKE